MDRQEYLNALEALGLPANGKRTALALGCALKTTQNYAYGVTAIPGPVMRLLDMYRKFGLPKEYRLHHLPEGEYRK